jgi:carbon storage regulator CsrA
MISLTRRPGEEVVIGAGVVIKVLEVAPGRVRLGVDAPPGSSVRRGEAAAQGPGPVTHGADRPAPLRI